MNPKQIWQATLGELQLQTSKPNYETWLRNTWAISHKDGVFTIGVPSTFAKEWLETRFAAQIQRTLSSLVGQPLKINIAVSQPGTSARANTSAMGTLELPPSEDAPFEDAETFPASEAPPLRLTGSSVGPDSGWTPNPRYTFDSFVVGSNNQLAHAAALAVARQPAQAYNPFFVYGGVGLGKTHLLHAIAHAVRQANLRVLYVSSEQFTNDLIRAIQQHRTEDFRNRYRTADVLLIDDIQFIAGKESTQEEFFHTFNALHGASRQIVISSDRPPRSMMTLEERLRSRFEWGLIADVQPPDLETRTAILRAKCVCQPVRVPDEVLAFIAQRVHSNIRELEGSLNRVVAYATLRNQPVTLSLASEALADLLASPVRRFLTTNAVLDGVARYYRVDLRTLRSKARGKDIVLPRQVAMYILREDLGLPLTEIGRELGGRDHSTVLHGCEKMAGDIEADAKLRKDISTIRENLYNAAKP